MISHTLYLQSLFITLARYCSIISCAHLLHKNISLYSAHRQLWQYELLKPLVLTIIGILLTRELADKTEIISWSADYSTLPLLTIILSIFIFFLGYLYKNF